MDMGSSDPVAAAASKPCVSHAGLVTIWMKPLTAKAPHREPAGPRTTSMRSISSIMVLCASHCTPEKNGVNRLRPSSTTEILLSARTLKPRVLIAQLRALDCPT